MLHTFLLNSYALHNFPYNLVVVTVSKQQDPEIAEANFQVMVMGPWFFLPKVTAVYVHTRVHVMYDMWQVWHCIGNVKTFKSLLKKWICFSENLNQPDPSNQLY